MNNIKSYTKYKPSGIAWLGEIPEHWNVRKLKYMANCFPSNVDKHSREGEEKVRLCNYTDVYKNDFITNNMRLMIASASNEQIKKFKLLQGDVIITKDSETADDIAVPAFVLEELDNVICGYHLSIIRHYEKMFGKYIFRLFQHKNFNSQFEICSNGVTRVGLGVYDLQNAFGIIPPLPEQLTIAAFLDFKLAKIDRFIRKKKQLIKLLNEQKTAIISQAVTCGLDENGNLRQKPKCLPAKGWKPSGIEWLGDMPEHWEVKPIKYFATCNDTALTDKTDKEYSLRYIDIGNVDSNGNVSEIVNYKFKDAPSRARRIVKDGDIIVSTVRTYLKAIMHISGDTENLIVSTGFAVLRPKNNVVSEYLNYAIRANYFISTIVSESKGVSYPAINSTDLITLKIALPSISEQKFIVSSIKAETTKIDQAIFTIEKEIALVEEYKTTIIAETVTGKIDVRDFEIPETLEEESYEELEEELSMVAEDEAEYETNDIE